MINIDDLRKILSLGCVPVTVGIAPQYRTRTARCTSSVPVARWARNPRLVRGRESHPHQRLRLAATNVVLYDRLMSSNTRSGPGSDRTMDTLRRVDNALVR